MTSERPWRRTHLAVPRADETLLAIPELDAAAESARANAGQFDDATIDLQGRPFDRVRLWARAEAVQLAKVFTGGALGDPAADADPTAPLVIPGHQPALYHPGVWAKNFAAAGIAKRLGGAALNLIVDNDIYSRPAIDLPAGTRDEPRRTAIAFDERQRARPWENAFIQDIDLFASFGDRVAATMRPWNVEPLIAGRWRTAECRRTLGADVPECLTAVRHATEASWGLHNLELRMSDLCESEPFLWVTGHLLAQLPRFVDVHNEVLAEYRRLYGLKSRNHPVPSLEERAEWLEAPFWVWRDDAPHRRRVFAKQAGNRTILADDTGRQFAVLPLSPTMEACCAVEVLRTLPSQGIRLRTRALTTTLFARLFLADLFVHGIGGAKYDEMTDRIIARFFGIPAPDYATVSASLYLPFAQPFDDSPDDERRLVALLRDLDQNPQRHLTRGFDPQIDRLLDEKAALIAEQDAAHPATISTRRQRRSRSSANALRFQRLQEVTSRLARFVAAQRDDVLQELAAVRRRLKADRILTSREFSFVLYPEQKLRPFLVGLTT
ncbi:MAG: hypothetical protein WBC44_16650 [Planctomycetaceae bacterium]